MLFLAIFYIVPFVLVTYLFLRLFYSVATSRWYTWLILVTSFTLCFMFFTGLLWQVFFGDPTYWEKVHLSTRILDKYWNSNEYTSKSNGMWVILPPFYIVPRQLLAWWWQFQTTYGSISIYTSDVIAVILILGFTRRIHGRVKLLRQRSAVNTPEQVQERIIHG